MQKRVCLNVMSAKQQDTFSVRRKLAQRMSFLVNNLGPLLHTMLVHLPIALLFGSVAFDWIGLWLKHAGLTRAGF
jgi:hypothetical protein